MESHQIKNIGVIPARMSSHRLPGKPLLDFHGMPMIEHVWRRSKLCKVLDEVYIATCDQVLFDTMTQQGAKVMMTSISHQRSTDRIAEAVEKIESEIKYPLNVVVNIGGDEPLVDPKMIDRATQELLDDDRLMTTNIVSAIQSDKEFADVNVVKVVLDLKGYVLFCSRMPVPLDFKIKNTAVRFKQVSIIPFRRDFLFTYNRLAPTPIEQMESIDMMRVLEHGYRIKAVKVSKATASVDTVADYELVKQMFNEDALFKRGYEAQ